MLHTTRMQSCKNNNTTLITVSQFGKYQESVAINVNLLRGSKNNGIHEISILLRFFSRSP